MHYAPALNALQKRNNTTNRLETLHDYTRMYVCAAVLRTDDSLVLCWREKKIGYLLNRPRNICFLVGTYILVKYVCNKDGYFSIKISFHDEGSYFSGV